MPVGWAIAVVVLWLAVLALTVVVLGLLRRIAPHLERAAAGGATAGRGSARPYGRTAPPGPAVGGALPEFAAQDRDGHLVTSAQLRGQPCVLLFLSSGCTSCVDLAAELSGAGLAEAAGSLIVVTDPESVGTLNLPACVPVLAMPFIKSARVLGIRVRPFAIAVDEAGVIRGARKLNSVAQLTDLAATIRPA